VVGCPIVGTYNARDEVTMVRQFGGSPPSDPADLSCPSGSCQKSEMTFDGHGRLKTSHAPEQQVDANNAASTDHMTWDYNADDTIQKITDPRGAVATFSYNNRHAVTNIAYTLLPNVPTTGPSGVASAATVSYTYDAAGNRKQMTDGMGNVTYNYDLLSRMTSETRFYSNLSGSSTGGNYTLSYEYNLDNQLTKLTDPNNSQISYAYDHIGRLSGVTGVGFSVSTFLSNIQYRAFGAPKSVAHKDGRTTETTYDARLRVSTYKLLPAIPDDGIRLYNQYIYYPDGRLKKLNDLDDHDPSIIGVTDSARWFSRVYTYDSKGRVLKSKGWNPNGYEFDFPYEQYYGYDAFDHMTARSGSYYYQPDFSESGSYSNNRRQGWSYGADGNETHSTGPGMFRDWTYNAAGQMVQVKETQTANNQFSTYVSNYDGDGELASEFLQESPTGISYKIRSSVVGEVVTRLNNVGNKTGMTVHLDDRVTPARMSAADTGGVPFPTYDDPLQQSIAGDRKAVYDPLGNVIPWRPWPGGPPPNFYPRSSSQFGSLGSSFGSAQERGCALDGIPTNCDTVMRLVNNGYPGRLLFNSRVVALEWGLIDMAFYRGHDQRVVQFRFLKNIRGGQKSIDPAPKEPFKVSNGDCSIEIKYAGDLDPKTPPFKAGPNTTKLGQYVSNGPAGSHGFRFEVIGSVGGVIGFVGPPTRDPDIKGIVNPHGTYTVGQQVFGTASVRFSKSGWQTLSPPPDNDDSPFPNARNIGTSTFNWHDSPGAYNYFGKDPDDKLKEFKYDNRFRVWATDGEGHNCSISFRIRQSLKNGVFKATISRE